MPRKKIILSDFYPYHVTARSNNKEWFDVPMEKVFNIFIKQLSKTADDYGLELHSFVLMKNHFHMLVSTPHSNLSEAMRYLMTETSRAIARSSGRINRIYGSRYHWTLIETSEYFAHAFKYIYCNPIKAGVVERVEAYHWTSLRKEKRIKDLFLNKSQGFDAYLPKNNRELLDWLNQKNDDDYVEKVGLALKKHQFKFSQDRLTGKKECHINALPPKNTPGT